jgi:DNA (cytosine-5)-methyltransferase 1
MSAYYNEIDPYAAQWLRNLIIAGHIADGVVDTRSIEDVQPDDLREFTQCHFFAGIGVWSYALRRGGWPDDRPVWTGSCPCQPFSEAGEGVGFADERHLWPHFHHLIKECGPASVIGEQVASKAAAAWIDLVHADLEGVGYTFGAVPFPSASVGAPHNRDRCYWVAHSNDPERRAEEPTWHNRVRTAPEWNESNCYAWKRLHDEDWEDFAASLRSFPDGVAPRLGRLRAYGNAINAEQARIFIECIA